MSRLAYPLLFLYLGICELTYRCLGAAAKTRQITVFGNELMTLFVREGRLNAVSE
jgi:hypothetical protein